MEGIQTGRKQGKRVKQEDNLLNLPVGARVFLTDSGAKHLNMLRIKVKAGDKGTITEHLHDNVYKIKPDWQETIMAFDLSEASWEEIEEVKGSTINGLSQTNNK